MIGDDIVGDVGGAQRCGMRALQVRTGKFRLKYISIAPGPKSAFRPWVSEEGPTCSLEAHNEQRALMVHRCTLRRLGLLEGPQSWGLAVLIQRPLWLLSQCSLWICGWLGATEQPEVSQAPRQPGPHHCPASCAPAHPPRLLHLKLLNPLAASEQVAPVRRLDMSCGGQELRPGCD
ncbi:Phospholysine phosphohistidine inorganic pyrophosphate phosphatase [Tupaia chinensis]|uniref:Phospholysine phosphohistidine inorganic pyrophosphate phosphatase n=1 Tax=Tupaia chinensis TaxID=246437 RepID=L9L7L0_TUPCH|nr:Phospholysine phosphohistidine inorganic pyrophosphate phosphatase [Tupaia chinensis]